MSKFNISGENLNYEKFEIEIKEVGNPDILTPTFTGHADVAYIVEFFGLNNDDVEQYTIYGIRDDKREIVAIHDKYK